MITKLEQGIDRALFEGHVDGWVAPFFSDERPLQGLAGWLDWRFSGAITAHLKSGALAGSEGECAYLPLTHAGRSIHVFLIGAGKRGAKSRGPIPRPSLEKLRENLAKVRIAKLGLSASDFGEESADVFQKTFKGIPLWIAN